MSAPTLPLLCTVLKRPGHHTTTLLKTVHQSSPAMRSKVSTTVPLPRKTSQLDELANLHLALSRQTMAVVDHPPSPSPTSVTSLSAQNPLPSPVQNPLLLSHNVLRPLLEVSTLLPPVRSCRRAQRCGRRSPRCSIPSLLERKEISFSLLPVTESSLLLSRPQYVWPSQTAANRCNFFACMDSFAVVFCRIFRLSFIFGCYFLICHHS